MSSQSKTCELCGKPSDNLIKGELSGATLEVCEACKENTSFKPLHAEKNTKSEEEESPSQNNKEQFPSSGHGFDKNVHQRKNEITFTHGYESRIKTPEQKHTQSPVGNSYKNEWNGTQNLNVREVVTDYQEIIQNIRKEENLSREKFGKIFSLSESDIKQIEEGQKMPSEEFFHQFEAVFDTNIAKIGGKSATQSQSQEKAD